MGTSLPSPLLPLDLLALFGRGDTIDVQTPLLLRDGDVITMGSTELLVALSDLDDAAESGTQL
jgi:hypothetical protein